MTFRKIIGFGGSSYVVSLPKEWVDKNKLKKGDDITIEEEGDWLRVGPHNMKIVKTPKEITIEYKENPRDLKTRLLHAYINNYSVINIKKPKIEKHTQEIRMVISNFIGLDVVEQKDDRLIVNDVLDISNISVYNHLRRMDRTVLSMAEDVSLILTGKENKDRLEILNQKDEDVNKLCNLLLKILRRAHNNNDMKILGLTSEEIFYYWELVISVEEVADQLKRLVRSIKGKVDSPLIELFNSSMEYYKTAMKANYTKDDELAVGIMIQRKEFSSKCDVIANKLDYTQYLMVEKIKTIYNFSGSIAKTLLKLGTISK